jgi:hypothetical protein
VETTPLGHAPPRSVLSSRPESAARGHREHRARAARLLW